MVRTRAGIRIDSPEWSLTVFVPKATSCRKVDREIKWTNSFTFSISSLHRNICSFITSSPGPCSWTWFLAFFIRCKEIPGKNSWICDWLYLLQMSDNIRVLVDLFSHSLYGSKIASSPTSSDRVISAELFRDLWQWITAYHKWFSCEEAMVPKTSETAF